MDRNFLSRATSAVRFRCPSTKQLVLFAVWVLYVWVTSRVALHGERFHFGRAAPELSGWACGAALLLAIIAVNPLAWLNGKRLVLGATAFAMMVGWFIALPAASLIPPQLAAAAPAILFVAGLLAILVLGFVALNLFAIFVAAPVAFFNQLFAFEHSLAVYRHKADGLTGRVARIAHWLRNKPLPESPPDESKGARFATRDEAIALHDAASKKPTRMAFGHWHQDKVPFNVDTDKHVLIMASTRSGKGVSLIIPHLLRYKGSAFVLDPKGENARATGRQRATLNERVHYLDPFGISGKPQSRFNPLSRFTPDNMEAESKALAAALFLTNAGERDHWSASGQQLLAALILYVYCSPDIPPGKKDLPMARQILLGQARAALEIMTEMDDADGLLASLARSFLDTPEKEFGSILSTAQRQTEILDNPAIAACLAARGHGPAVDFCDWHNGTMTVYMCLSAPKFPVFNRWLRLVLTSALDEMTDRLDPPKLPVCFMLDELATLGHLAPVENAIGLAAGYGVQLVTVFQDVAQMRDLYKGRWASFVGNAGIRALFSLDDYETADYWSKFIGGRLVETRSTQQDIYGYSKGDSVGETMRPLLPPDRLMMEFASGNMLVLAQGAHPFVSARVPYWADQQLAGTWDDPRAPVTGTPMKPLNPPPPSRPTTPPASPPPSTPPAQPTAERETGIAWAAIDALFGDLPAAPCDFGRRFGKAAFGAATDAVTRYNGAQHAE